MYLNLIIFSFIECSTCWSASESSLPQLFWLQIWILVQSFNCPLPTLPIEMSDLDQKATTLVLRSAVCCQGVSQSLGSMWGARASWPTMGYCWCCQRFAKHLAWPRFRISMQRFRIEEHVDSQAAGINRLTKMKFQEWYWILHTEVTVKCKSDHEGTL